MKVELCKHTKNLSTEEWKWIKNSLSIIPFMENKLRIVLTKDYPSSVKYGPDIETQIGSAKLYNYLEDNCESMFYIDYTQGYEQIIIDVYFYSRNDLMKMKMSLLPAFENNEFTR